MKTAFLASALCLSLLLFTSCTSEKPYQPVESIAFLEQANSSLSKKQRALDAKAAEEAARAESEKPLNSLFAADILELDFRLDQPQKTASDSTAPKVIKAIAPHYPQAAIKKKIEGSVLVSALINTDGTVGEAKIVKSAHESLENSALLASKAWTFEPALYKGQPVTCKLGIPLTFKLKLKE